MNTIQWIVGLIPKTVRPLFAVLLIAISVLSSTLVYVYKRLDQETENKKDVIVIMSKECEHKTDSLNSIIMSIKDANKKEIINRLEEIINEQKQEISSQKNILTKQSVIKNMYKK